MARNIIDMNADGNKDDKEYETMSEISSNTGDTLEQQRFADQHQLDAGILKELTDMKLKVEECFKHITQLQKQVSDEKKKRIAAEKEVIDLKSKVTNLEDYNQKNNTEFLFQYISKRIAAGGNMATVQLTSSGIQVHKKANW